MQYDELCYVPEDEDPSVTIETERLIVKVIDNTGLVAPSSDSAPFRGLGARITDLTHHLGYHGIRTLFDREERRNLVVPFVSWLNLQTAILEGIEPDPIDERAFAGMARGWPMRLERQGDGAILRLDRLPNMQMAYSLELQPGGPGAIDFTVQFEFGRRPRSGPARFRATWPCYMNGYGDVRLYYPRLAANGDGPAPEGWVWATIGERPDIILGETVGYEHRQTAYFAEDQALPLGYGRIGDNALIIMFSDPSVRLFVVNAGGHLSFSPVQNPAWDFEWIVEDYPLHEPIGFRGRLVYTRFEGQGDVLARYEQWVDCSDG